MRSRLPVGLAVAPALAFAVALAAASPVAAQSRLSASVVLAAAGARTTEGPAVTVQHVFGDQRSRELLSNGFPARLTITVELWVSGTLFDHLWSTVTWQRVVRFDPLSKKYRVGRDSAAVVVDEARFASIEDVSRSLSAPVRAPLPAPQGRRRLYYTANVTIETFNSNDLGEVQRWLQGDVQPALKGEKNPGSALTRGIMTLFSRLLGGDVKRVVGRSDVFDT